MFATTLIAISLLTTPAQAADEDGCWSGQLHSGEECLVVQSVEQLDGKVRLKLRNQCQERLYARFCLEKRDDGKLRWSCGASGIRGGDTKSWTTYDSTGKHFEDAIGSNTPSKDWVCSSKIGLEEEPD